MRILHVITDLDTGGTETMLLRLLSASPQRLQDGVLSLTDEGTLGARIRELGIPLYTLGLRRSLPNPARALSIRGLSRRLQPRLIQGWMPHGNLMASLAASALKGRVPVIWNVRQSLYDLGAEPRTTAALIRLGARISRRTAAIIYNTRIGAEHHEALGYCAAKRVIVHNGFDSRLFRPDPEAYRQVRTNLGVKPETLLVGLVARFHPMKDHATFLQAAGLVAREHPEVSFLLAGLGVTRENPALWELVTKHQLQDRIFFLGERADVPQLTASLDVACSSSWTEGLSNTIGEAMASGIPCVATDVGDNAYLIGNTGVCVPPRDPESLALAINTLVAAGQLRRRELGTAARQRIESEFSIEVIAGRYEELYHKHLQNGG